MGKYHKSVRLLNKRAGPKAAGMRFDEIREERAERTAHLIAKIRKAREQ